MKKTQKCGFLCGKNVKRKNGCGRIKKNKLEEFMFVFNPQSANSYSRFLHPKMQM